MLIEADWIWTRPGALVRGGGLWIEGQRVRAVLESPRQVAEVAGRAGERLRLGAWLLMPGWINAHAHLDLTFLRGRLQPGPDFGAWVRAVLAARAAADAADLDDAVREGLSWCLAGGATAVGDIVGTDSPTLVPGLPAAPLRVALGEVLDGGDAGRRDAQLERLESFGSEAAAWGFSPHAPHTCSPELLAACARRGEVAQVPLQVHWAETRDEVEYLAGRTSAFDALLPALGAPTSGCERLAAAGLLGARTSLVHGNFAEPEDWPRLARAGASLVHCPGTHAFFERGETPLAAALEAGVPIALGTDSAASNAALDLPRELALALELHPQLTLDQALASVTVHGARALGLDSDRGRLVAGARADLFAVELGEARPSAPDAALLSAALREPERQRRVFLGGVAAHPWGAVGAGPEDPAWSWSGAAVAERWSSQRS
ncbi:MAG: amidohydrolase family protein [Planctomycetota bacterium]|jgi:cytosine/adenosine deaminase-related metal-dependent hydrolase